MKTTIITAILTLLATLSMKGSPLFSVMEVEDNTDIKLDGRSEDDNKKSLLFPFGAYQIGHQEVCVTSYNNYASVTISIIDVYGNSMDVQSSSLTPQQVVSFDISSYPHGTYTLVISTPQGTYLTGVFEVE